MAFSSRSVIRFTVIVWGIPLALLLIVTPVQAQDSVTLGFRTEAQWNEWEPVTFPDVAKSRYEFHEDSGVVCGTAQQSASGLARQFPGTLSDWPMLSWEWKIDGVLESGNARKRSGDDYAARVYVNFERDTNRWSWWERTKASVFESFYGEDLPGQSLNFIWANQIDKRPVDSPYTRHTKLIPLRTGNARSGEWVSQTINIRVWYQNAFGTEPPPVQSVAIMTDSDNTGSKARGCYRNMVLHGSEDVSSSTSP